MSTSSLSKSRSRLETLPILSPSLEETASVWERPLSVDPGVAGSNPVGLAIPNPRLVAIFWRIDAICGQGSAPALLSTTVHCGLRFSVVKRQAGCQDRITVNRTCYGGQYLSALPLLPRRGVQSGRGVHRVPGGRSSTSRWA